MYDLIIGGSRCVSVMYEIGGKHYCEKETENNVTNLGNCSHLFSPYLLINTFSVERATVEPTRAEQAIKAVLKLWRSIPTRTIDT